MRIDARLWLVGTPAHDVNFRSALKRATLSELILAYFDLETQELTKTARTRIRGEIRRRLREE